MLSKILFEAPHIWKIIRDLLIGNGGKPDANGNAAGGLVRDAEIKYNQPAGSYWYRFFRPNDAMISGGTAKQYYSTFTTVTEEDILSTGAAVTVQTREAVLYIGWYDPVDLGKKGYLEVKKESVVKSSLIARWVYRQQKPDHFYVDLDTSMIGWENASFNFIIYNGLPSDRTGICIPLLFRIASRSQLNLEKPIR